MLDEYRDVSIWTYGYEDGNIVIYIHDTDIKKKITIVPKDIKSMNDWIFNNR